MCRVLKHLNTTTDTHSVIFTSGCTGALKLLAKTFDWDGSKAGNGMSQMESSARSSTGQGNDDLSGMFCYIQDNHTSVVGMREVANARGAKSLCLSESDVSKVFDHVKDNECGSSVSKSTQNALPVPDTVTQDCPVLQSTLDQSAGNRMKNGPKVLTQSICIPRSKQFLWPQVST